MLKRLITLSFSLALILGQAATWYVRPGVQSKWVNPSPHTPIPDDAVYGYQNGTSWANAWNGLESIVWGSGGVQTGDTLYVCGYHVYSVTNSGYRNLQARVPIGTSGFTMRMDYPSDPGLIFGGSFDREYSYPWFGPDANGVYSCTNYWNIFGNGEMLCWEVDGTNLYRLNTNSAATWTGAYGSWSQIGNSNYVKMVNGTAPSNNIALNANGWSLILGMGISNVTFQSCSFIGGGFFIETPQFDGAVLYPPGNVPLNFLANHITFNNCVFRDSNSYQMTHGEMIGPQTGNDYWTFNSCEVGYGPAGIYAGMGYQSSTNQLRGVYAMVVRNCYIHDTANANYPAADGHGIGLQEGSSCSFIHNTIPRTGNCSGRF